jgi:lipopolysaccharide export system protein LptA
MQFMKKINRSLRKIATLAALCLMTSISMPAFSEKGDRDKPINITADRGFEDNKKQEAIFEGNVLLTQGTLRVEADRIVVRRDKEGFDHATATGKPARLRQKRDGLDEYVEGFGERIEFDGSQEIIQLFDKAKLTRGQDELTSNYIQYNSRTEVFQASNPGEKTTSTGERVRAVIQPKPKK